MADIAESVEASIGLRERKRRQTHRALVDAAIRLFTEQGYAATTVERVAAEAGVSARTAFRYFPTKEDLVLADYEAEIETWATVLRQAPAGQPLLTALRAASAAVTADYEARPDFFDAVMHLIATEPALTAAAQQLRARLADRAAQELAVRLDADLTTDPRPQLLAAAAMATVEAGTRRWYAEGKPVPRAAAIETAFDVLEDLGEYLRTPLP